MQIADIYVYIYIYGVRQIMNKETLIFVNCNMIYSCLKM